MKSWLRKLFYLDDPAQGAFFALTLWGVGYYWLFSLTAVFQDWGSIWRPLPLIVLLSGLAIFPLCYLLMALSFYDRLIGAYHEVWIGFLVWIGLLVAFNVLILNLGIVWNVVGVAAFMFLLQLMFCGRLCMCMLGAVAVLLSGGGMAVILFWSVLSGYLYVSFIPEYVWRLWVGIGLPLMLISYLCFAGFFAGIGKKSFRSMFNRPVLALLASAGAIYLIFLVMVIFAKWECTGEWTALERHFGRAVSTEALKRYYYAKREGDHAYWDKFDDIRPQFGDFKRSETLFIRNPFVVLSPDDLICFREQWSPAENQVREYEAHFSGDIPLPALDFRKRPLSRIESPAYWRLDRFLQLEGWRIRLLLADGDVSSALKVYERMTGVNRFLLQDIALDHGTAWQAATGLQLDALQLLLESGRLSAEELRMLGDGLQNIEAGMPALQLRALYTWAVAANDEHDMLIEGFRDEDFESKDLPPFPLRAVRFFVPQCWWNALRAKAEAARYFRITDFNQLPSPKDWEKMSIIGQLMIPDQSIGTKFDEALARLRAMRGLIAAEECKLKYGDYPATMPDLPLDPFSGKPLLYRKGACPYRVTQMQWGSDPTSESGWSWQTETADAEVPAIQVWSVGPDRVDSGGVSDRDGGADDVRAILRLKP